MFKKKERTENKKTGKGVVWKLLGCLIIAAALFAVLLNVESNVLSDYEKKMTVICKEQIPMGKRITEVNAEQYFETYEIDVKLVSENTVTDKSELVGTVAARTMDVREIVKDDDFTKESGIYSKYKEPVEASFKAEHPGYSSKMWGRCETDTQTTSGRRFSVRVILRSSLAAQIC